MNSPFFTFADLEQIHNLGVDLDRRILACHELDDLVTAKDYHDKGGDDAHDGAEVCLVTSLVLEVHLDGDAVDVDLLHYTRVATAFRFALSTSSHFQIIQIRQF